LAGFSELIKIQKAMFHEVSLIVPKLPTERFEDETSTKLPYKRHWTQFSNFLIDSIRNQIEHMKKISLESRFSAIMRHHR
jgi:hypothetical protein